MGLFDNVDKRLHIAGRAGSDVRNANTPEAYRPRLDVGDEGGYIQSVAYPQGQVPDAKDILKSFDLDPDQWIVTGLRRSKWQRYDGEFLESHRITVVPALLQQEDMADVEQMIKDLNKWKPSKSSSKTSGELAFIFAPSDQQIGKKQGGQGTPETIDRILKATEGAVERLHELRKIGRNVGTVVIALLGDHVEGNVSQGGRLQSHSASDLGLTEQTRVGRRLLMAQIKAFAPLVDRIIVAVVNGNHDEVSRQVALDPSEGWNTEIASSVQDACAENKLLSHVEFRYPAKDHQTLALEVCGTMIGLFHGHQTGKDVLKYLSEQAAGQTPLGGADVWLSGHYHNFRSMDIGSRFWAQCPTVDPGSAWYRDRRGLESNSGILTLVVGDGHDPRKDVSVIPATI
jgi:predicted phosphodiesterase